MSMRRILRFYMQTGNPWSRPLLMTRGQWHSCPDVFGWAGRLSITLLIRLAFLAPHILDSPLMEQADPKKFHNKRPPLRKVFSLLNKVFDNAEALKAEAQQTAREIS